MMKDERVVSWVVYRVTVNGAAGGVTAVCEQAEWDALRRASPGDYTLVKKGITNEAEAERLARGTSGDPPVRLKAR